MLRIGTKYIRIKTVDQVFLIYNLVKTSVLCLTNLSDAHGTEDVEKDEGAVSIVLTRKVTVRDT